MMPQNTTEVDAILAGALTRLATPYPAGLVAALLSNGYSVVPSRLVHAARRAADTGDVAELAEVMSEEG